MPPEPVNNGSSAKAILLTIVAVAAVLFGLTGGKILGVTPTVKPTVTASATIDPNPVMNAPAPDLFKNKDMLLVAPVLTAQLTKANTNIENFWSDQLTQGATDDDAFVAWATDQVKTEPSAATRRADLAKAATMAPSAARQEAARWTALHGCRDVWTNYVLLQKAMHGDDDRNAKNAELELVLNMAAKVAANIQAKFTDRNAASAAPLQAPCTPRTAAAREDCTCSFPSSSAAMAAAARTYLSATNPRMAAEYRWAERQIDTGTIYQKFELASDVEAGAYIGYLTGKYFLASRGYADLTSASTATS